MRHARPVQALGTADLPVAELNTTPLIDVMLVLLVMFIVTVPVATHKVALDLPQGPPPIDAHEPVVHRIDLDAAGRLYWNGAAIAASELPARLDARGGKDEVHMRADPATPYERFDETLATVKRANVDRLGLIDNQRFAAF